jgi:signal transduction histidine kinase
MLGNYVASARLAESLDLPIGPLDPTYVLFMLTVTLLGTALTAVVYSERAQSFFRYRKALEAERDLKETQRRVILAENAASLGRLAAALSHELNSPIGALSSAVDTLLLLSAKQSAKPIDPQRFVVLLNDLRKTIGDSTNRLSDIVSRMQRIANLDRSEVQRVSVNELINDAVEISGARLRERARLNLELGDVPSMICKPQQLSAVFRNLVTNSVEALNGNGQIRISSKVHDSNIEVEVQDNGKGMDKAQLSSLFDPEFRVDGNRVGTGNWSMFSARQVVREHGGEITVNSKPGEGTRVLITFPIQHFEANAHT